MPENFEIAYPWVFVLIVLPIFVYWIWPPLRIRSASLLLPTYQKAIAYTGQKPRKSALVKHRGILSWTLLMVTWILLLGAMSSPRLVGEPELKVKTVRNFLIVADISFSMAQRDWTIDGEKARRWDAVKAIMKEFIKKREGDRMGLIFFGSSSYIQAPFTPDLVTVEQLLEEADVGMAGQMTHIGKAISMGVDMFDKDTIDTKVMLMLTDGVDAGTDVLPLDAAQKAQKDSVIIYTIGIGDPAGAESDLDEKTLQEIAEMTDGQYFLAIDEDRLQEIYTEVDKLEPIEYEEEENRPVTLLYMYPLGAALTLTFMIALLNSVFNAFRSFQTKKETYA